MRLSFLDSSSILKSVVNIFLISCSSNCLAVSANDAILSNILPVSSSFHKISRISFFSLFDSILSYKVVAVYKSEIVESSFLVALDNCSLNNILVFKAVVHLVNELLYDLIKSFITIFLSSNALVLSVSIIDCNCSLAVSQYLIYFSTQDNNIRYSLPIFSIQALLLTFLRYHLTSFIQSIVDTQVVLLVKALPTAYFNHL